MTAKVGDKKGKNAQKGESLLLGSIIGHLHPLPHPLWILRKEQLGCQTSKAFACLIPLNGNDLRASSVQTESVQESLGYSWTDSCNLWVFTLHSPQIYRSFNDGHEKEAGKHIQ